MPHPWDTAATSSIGLGWDKTDQNELYGACHAARAESDLSGLIATFAKIIDTETAYDF